MEGCNNFCVNYRQKQTKLTHYFPCICFHQLFIDSPFINRARRKFIFQKKTMFLKIFFYFSVCAGYGFLGFFCGVVSIATLTAISYARYLKVCGVRYGM